MTKTNVPAALAAEEPPVAPGPQPDAGASSPSPEPTPPPPTQPDEAALSEHVLVLVDLPEVGGVAGRVIRGGPDAIARLPTEAVRPATADEISLAAPRFIVLED